ncbi:MAG TPA: tRNA isopentenyl-2-thiomethyl-A-37 hydroxylase MiaE [Polyangiaceae bacterium]|jgi:tRNA-(ms[2]io[6]A)-hydroxylase
MLCLKVPTDAAWAVEALGEVDAVLADHAHCEMKAASNALSLATRHLADAELVRALTDLAREEIEHFQRVLAVLVERGVPLGPPPVDAYAAELRRAANELPRGAGDAAPLVDRLLVGALVEARSCERFKLLAEATAARPEHASLHALWNELLAAEARHYRTFVELATRAAGGERDAVQARLERLASLEGDIVRALADPSRTGGASRATIHG